jgi:hypothetical protein
MHAAPYRLSATLAILTLASLAAPVMAADIKVVTGKATPVVMLSREEVAEVFLGQRPGTALVAFDQEDEQIRARFYRSVADMSLSSVRAYWAKRVFTGRGRPPARLKAGQIDSVITNRANAVSYIASERIPPGGKVLLRFESEENP